MQCSDCCLVAYLDDIYFVCRPERVGGLYAALQDALRRHAGIQIHCGKTKIWNRAGVRHLVCDVLERVAQAVNPTARVWRGSMLPEELQGMKVLGTPLGHPEFVARHLRSVSREQQVLLDRIPLVQDVQSAWLLLLHCASARANYLMRAVSPDSTAEFAQSHDEALWQCLCLILRIDPTQTPEVRDAAALPLSLGGLGLRSACRMKVPAYWASWADCLGMIHQRHPDVADQLVRELDGDPQTPCLHSAASAVRELTGFMGFAPPSWDVLTTSLRPVHHEPEEFEPGSHRGWQHEASREPQEVSQSRPRNTCDLCWKTCEDSACWERLPNGSPEPKFHQRLCDWCEERG